MGNFHIPLYTNYPNYQYVDKKAYYEVVRLILDLIRCGQLIRINDLIYWRT
jgi:hypothetical protein